MLNLDGLLKGLDFANDVGLGLGFKKPGPSPQIAIPILNLCYEN